MKLRVWQQLMIMVSVPVAFQIAELVALGDLLVHTEDVSSTFVRSKSLLLRYQMAVNSIDSALLKILSIVIPSAPALDLRSLAEGLSRSQSEIISVADLRSEVAYAIAKADAVFADVLELARKAEFVSRNPSIPVRQRLVAIGPELLTAVPAVTSLSKRMIDADAHLTVTAQEEINKWRLIIITVTVSCVVASSVTSILMAAAFITNILSRLRVIEDNAADIAMRKPLRPPLPGDDELADLDQALHETGAQIFERHTKELAILNKAVDVLCSIDKQLRFKAVGASAISAWHFAPDDLLGRSLLTLLPAEDAAKVSPLLSQLKRGTETEFETVVQCGDGQNKEFLWRISKTENGAFYCIARDITERLAVARAKQRLLAVASHDVRTPLSAISSSFALLQAGAYGQLNPVTAETIKGAETNLERLMDLIRDLLELEKLESGKFVLQLGCVSALDVCDLAVQSSAAVAKNANIKIVFFNSDASVLADERRLVQILINLIGQAIKISRTPGEVTVSIRARESSVEFSITASGASFAVDDPDLIFEKFYQTKTPATETSPKSNNLGLVIAKTLVQAHDGEIGAEITGAGDCRFWFTVPTFEAPDELEIEARN